RADAAQRVAELVLRIRRHAAHRDQTLVDEGGAVERYRLRLCRDHGRTRQHQGKDECAAHAAAQRAARMDLHGTRLWLEARRNRRPQARLATACYSLVSGCEGFSATLTERTSGATERRAEAAPRHWNLFRELGDPAHRLGDLHHLGDAAIQE